MRVVLLTGSGLEHRYVANVLVESLPEAVVGIVTAGQPSFRVRLRSWLRRYTLRQIASRIAARFYRRFAQLDEQRQRTYARVLFAGQPPEGLPRRDLHHHVASHNHPESIALLRQLAPDVIVTYGTAIIRRDVISIPPRGIVNLHTGLSPWYRGADTIFWALHEEEPQHVGITVHLVSERVDGGAVLCTARPELSPDDDEDSLFAKGVIVGAPLLVSAVRDLASGDVRAIPQDLSLGREFRFVDRTISSERRVARLLRNGLLSRRDSTAK